MATIQEVARSANVSVATVSRYLNNPDVVAGKTRDKVEAAIQALNYEPSFLGRNLRKSESRLIIVLIPNISNPFYAKIINGIEDTALENGYNILLCQTDSKAEREATYFNLIKNQLADGMITMDPTVNRQNLTALSKQYPVVQCSEYDEDEIIPYVSIDNKMAAYHAVEHLAKQGHKRIALINSDEFFLYARERKEGYVQAMEAYHLEIDDTLIYTADDLTIESGRNAIIQLFNNINKPTAVFCVSDMFAIGALKGATINHLQVPDDIAIVGFDNVDYSNMTYPELTTINQPMYQMGVEAAHMLIQKMQGQQVKSMLLDHELIVRGSTTK